MDDDLCVVYDNADWNPGTVVTYFVPIAELYGPGWTYQQVKNDFRGQSPQIRTRAFCVRAGYILR